MRDATDQTPRAQLEGLWRDLGRSSASDPFTNPYLLFAMAVNRRLAEGDLTPADLENVVQDLSAEGGLARAVRLRRYLDLDGAPPVARIEAMFERLADQGFDRYAEALANAPVGLVTTGHPTFALTEALSLAIVELATGEDAAGEPLSDPARQAREQLIRDTPHGPPETLTLDVEHAWSVKALSHAADALDLARRCGWPGAAGRTAGRR